MVLKQKKRRGNLPWERYFQNYYLLSISSSSSIVCSIFEGYKLCSQGYKLQIEFFFEFVVVYMLPLVALFSYANSKITHNLCFYLCIICFLCQTNVNRYFASFVSMKYIYVT